MISGKLRDLLELPSGFAQRETMPGLSFIRGNLTSAEIRAITFLTLAFFLSSFTRLSHAENYYTVEEKQQIGDVENYVRKQSLQGMSLLPSEARTAIGWFSGNWHVMPLSGEDGEDETLPDNPHNVAEQTEQNEGFLPPVNVAGNFHHKDFLPTHDAMVMGVGVTGNAFGDKLKFTAHPFYGQNWRSLQGYWGTELALDIDKRQDGMPWGKIAIGYVDGNESLTDRGRGMDMHGDVDLTHGLTFTSGMRQNNAAGDSNYVMLRWSMGFD